MINLVINYWYLFLTVLIAGIIGTLLIQNFIRELLKNFLSKAPLIKTYWLFIIPFVVITISLYFIVIIFSTKDREVYLSTLNHATTLIFAIFVGYFAFLQVVENRLEKLREQGHTYFKQKSYLRAIEYYEQAYVINPKDFSILAELLEVYLVQSDQKFDRKIVLLDKLVIEDKEKLIAFYLKTAKHLFRQDIGRANNEIVACLNFIKNKPTALTDRIWDFSDIHEADIYKKLVGEAKNIFDNFLNYIQNGLNEEKKKNFENGNYTLS